MHSPLHPRARRPAPRLGSACLQGRPDLSLSVYLRLRTPAVFPFIQQHALHQHLLGRAPDLLEVGSGAVCTLPVRVPVCVRRVRVRRVCGGVGGPCAAMAVDART